VVFQFMDNGWKDEKQPKFIINQINAILISQ